jgi:PAS domain S-box-containing protein
MGVRAFAGILVANVLARDLFSVLEGGQHREVNRNVVLVSADGHFLYHSEKKKDWNKLLASREEDNLQNEYPASVVAKIISGTDGTVLDGIDDIISYAPLFPTEGAATDGEVHSRFAMPLFVFESVPKDAIMGPVYSFARKFTGFLFLFFVVAIGLGLLATRQFTKPIAALERGAEIIAKGNYGHRIRVDTRDEIEKLATQFNSMAVSLEAHEREIQQHRTQLEEIVKQRTHELSEEKAKLQAIVNNVPSAFVLLDKEFRIQTASAAIASVTGHLLDDVKGLDCSAVICRNGFCKDCISRRALAAGGIESHIDQTLDQKGDERFIEHTAIPLKENGEIISILEIITDVTERKRLQERLVQTEKLMAVGQMSSLIAHEFRNSLTSIKMILQLQTESKRLSHPDKKSLSVALKSINQMEGIVTDLLNFARPKPMEFSVGSLNDAIDESLSLAQPHINKSGIAVKKRLDPMLPGVLIDTSHFKEALVNIYLNAVQAIDSNAQKAHRKEISIVTRKTRLRNTLKEFYIGGGSEGAAPAGKDIMLRSGTECAVLEISDTGSGIEQMQFSRIFDPFFTTKSSGTGLGLPMVKRTVNAHGGIIDMRSKTGEGTTFIIYMPLLGEKLA